MLLCVGVLALAVLLGAVLAAGRARRWAPVHGSAGAAAFLTLAVADMRAPPRGPAGWDALGLLALALGGGLAMWLGWRRGRRPGLLVFLHAIGGGLALLLLAGAVLGG